MKKIISIIMATIIVLGCVGCSATQKPAPTEPPMTTKPIEQPTGEPEHMDNIDEFTLNGLIYKTQNGYYMLLEQKSGGIIVTNGDELFKDIEDFTYIECSTALILESYPAQMNVESFIVPANHNINDEEQMLYNMFLDEMTEMGYGVDKAEPEQSSTNNNYDTMAILCDNLFTEKNAMFSPLSLNYALSMASNSGDDITKEEFQKYFGVSVEEYTQWCGNYIKSTSTDDSAIEIANALFVRNGYNVKPEFEQTLNSNYDALVESREFNEDFINEVNDWCKEKTHDMIPSILTSPPPESTISLILNALYFKAEWESQYEEYQIEDCDFIDVDGTVSTVSGLFEEDSYVYLENDKATGFAKPYANGPYVFIGILPKFEGDFTLQDLDLASLMSNYGKQVSKVRTMIPKFKFENTFDSVTPALAQAGLNINNMSFNMVEEESLSVSQIIQKTAIDLTESGTTAAAVTAMMFDNCAAIEPEEVKEIILNRPFAFMIYDTENDTVLFIGKVTDPHNM